MAPLLASKGEAECKADIDALRVPSHDATGMYRMSMVGDMRYDSSLPFVEAIDYILRMGESHPMMVSGDCLYGYRVHSDSLTLSDPSRRDRMVASMLERTCERRGQSYSSTFPQSGDGNHQSSNSLIDNGLAGVFVESVLSQRRTNRRWGAVKTGLQCARLHPFDTNYYKALVYALGPAGLPQFIRSSKQMKK
jgi:hypothetical protein